MTETASTSANVAERLSYWAARRPEAIAVVEPGRRSRGGKRAYRSVTFAELEHDTNCIAAGLRQLGVEPGMRMVLLVRPGIDFIALTFALFKAGAVIVLIDPGMGRRHLLDCLEAAAPRGFIAIPLAQAVRWLKRKRFPHAQYNVTVGPKRFWPGVTLHGLRQSASGKTFQPFAAEADDPAAVIFTTGSTGPPKGVLYRHGNFERQVVEIQGEYNIEPGEIDLACFPLFGLFNAAMGVTTVIPDMNPTRPASVDPRNIVEAVRDWQITQSFGSPAVWNVVGRYCETNGIELPSLKRVLSAGAPVPPHVLAHMKKAIASDGDIHTPYGATEALPVATVSASEVLGETAARSAQGAGTCVGRRFPGIAWRVIPICDAPLAEPSQWEALPPGEIGELIVRGAVVTREYATRAEWNAWAKIIDADGVWHRMGDVGYLDERDRFWFCGRMAHRVTTAAGPMFTIPCEAIFNAHERVYRSALVGIHEDRTTGFKQPAIVFECWPEKRPASDDDLRRLIEELHALGQQHAHTRAIATILYRETLPVDIRHNAKIFREKLGPWVEGELAKRR